jgi:hypothetical protein
VNVSYHVGIYICICLYNIYLYLIWPYICIYIYICTYIYAYIYTHIHTYIHIYTLNIYIYPRSCFVSYQRLVVLSSTSHEFTAPTLHSCAVHRCSVCKALCAAAMACELWISEHPEKSNFQWILGGLTLIWPSKMVDICLYGLIGI